MTETTAAPASAPAETNGSAESDNGGVRTKRRPAAAGLSAMVLPELKALASSMGISGTGAMRKGDLIAAIQGGQTAGSNGSGNSTSASSASNGAPVRAARTPRRGAAAQSADAAPTAAAPASDSPPVQATSTQADTAADRAPEQTGCVRPNWSVGRQHDELRRATAPGWPEPQPQSQRSR